MTKKNESVRIYVRVPQHIKTKLEAKAVKKDLSLNKLIQMALRKIK